MTQTPRPPHADMQKLSDSSAGLYEAIATLEYMGRTVSRGQLAAATGLSDAAVADSLRLLVEHDFVLERAGAEGPVYVPASRGWSAVPSQATGKPLSSGAAPASDSAGAEPRSSAGSQPANVGGGPPGPAGRQQGAAGVTPGIGAGPTMSWSDSGSVAVISWSTAAGQVFRRETADRQEAARLIQSIEDDDQLALVSAQVRRVGIGPDS